MEVKQRDALSVVEARERLGGISNAVFYQLVNAGELRTFTIGRRRLVSQSAITEFINRREGVAAGQSSAA